MKIQILTFICCSLISTVIFAFNESFLVYTPVYYFTPEDTQLFKNAQQNALDNVRDGAMVTWKNPKTGAYGTVTPMDSTNQNNMKCRHLRIFNAAHGVTGQSNIKLCKINNVWHVGV